MSFIRIPRLGALVLAVSTSLVAPTAAQGFSSGAVYTSTNEAAGNRVAVFSRAQDGTATFDQFVATGGTGSDDGLGNQGAVTLSDDGSYLYVVNAGSDDLSVFSVLEDGLSLIEVVDSRGERPVSVAQHDDLVYVLNAGDDRIAGFRQQPDGTLRRLGRARLSTTGTGAAQIDFSNDGRFVYVTEKATNSITRYRVTRRGGARQRQVFASDGATPFGFLVGQRNQLIVSQADMGAPGASAVTSYDIDGQDGGLTVRTGSLGSGETAACWVVGTPDGRLAFVSNTGTDTVSSLGIGFDGSLSLLDAQAATTGDGPVDMALTADGHFFYVLNAAAGGLGDYVVGTDGSLTGLPGSPGGLPTFASGLAAR